MDVNKLRGIMAERGITGEKVAAEIGVTPKTFYQKLKKGVFRTDEATKIVKLLKIDDPASIFLTEK